MSEYTPTTEQVRTEWIESTHSDSPTVRLHSGAAFDRWLAGVCAEAAQSGYDEHADTLHAHMVRAQADLDRLRHEALAALIPTWLLRRGSRIIRHIRADAWDEGHDAGQINEHEYRPGRQMTNPYTANED